MKIKKCLCIIFISMIYFSNNSFFLVDCSVASSNEMKFQIKVSYDENENAKDMKADSCYFNVDSQQIYLVLELNYNSWSIKDNIKKLDSVFCTLNGRIEHSDQQNLPRTNEEKHEFIKAKITSGTTIGSRLCPTSESRFNVSAILVGERNLRIVTEMNRMLMNI